MAEALPQQVKHFGVGATGSEFCTRYRRDSNEATVRLVKPRQLGIKFCPSVACGFFKPCRRRAKRAV